MKKFISLIMVLILVFTFVSCEKNEPKSTEPSETKSEEPQASSSETEVVSELPADISERAMANFEKKLNEEQYIMTAPGYNTVTVHSKDAVIFKFEEKDLFRDFCAMSLNNEAFQGFFSDDGIYNITFLGEITALKAARMQIPNYWFDEEVSDNIFELFYNDVENPLKFMSKDYTVMSTALTFAGYGQSALPLMHEVYLILDNEDPSVAHITCEIDDDEVARHYFDDIDITIEFKETSSDSRLDAWFASPVYPNVKTYWDGTDEFILDSIFFPGYGLDAVPFPTYASYAFLNDAKNFVYDNQVSIRDSHATEEQVEEYKKLLLDEGFTEVKEADENGIEHTYFRRSLRPEYKCYTQISIEYNNGANLIAKKYYENDYYETLEEINPLIGDKHYPMLPDTSSMVLKKAFDSHNQLIESWQYMFDYDMELFVTLEFTDEESLNSYIDDYTDSIIDAGFKPRYESDEESPIDHYEGDNSFHTWRYHIEDEPNTVTFLYKAERIISAEEANQTLKKAGFPQITIPESFLARDLTKYHEQMFGDKEHVLWYSIACYFESDEEGNAYLDELTTMLESKGYERTNPASVSCSKDNAYYNEKTDMLVSFDYDSNETGAAARLEFRK